MGARRRLEDRRAAIAKVLILEECPLLHTAYFTVVDGVESGVGVLDQEEIVEQ